MKLSSTSKNIRFALFVFVGLVIFSMAQLTWWAIFQIDNGRKRYDLQVELSKYKIKSAVYYINRDLGQTAVLMDNFIGTAENETTNIQRNFEKLLTDSIIIGFQLTAKDGMVYHTAGKIDSTFYYRVGNSAIIYFDSDCPTQLTRPMSGEILFSPDHHLNGENKIWVSEKMFEIAPGYLAKLDNESYKRTRMFVIEGGFFMLVMLFGAFLIYRTLQRSEDLTFRQVNFIQAVTHEFRTPLTSLRLYLETLQSGNVEQSKKQKLFSNMLSDCERLEGMVDNILKAGHFGREDYKLKLTETNLSRDIFEYLHGIQTDIKNVGGEITTDLKDNIMVLTDYEEMGRAIRALIDNALKYSPPEKRVINVSLKKEKQQAVIVITDLGIGIPKEKLSKIFDRFYRVADSSTASVKGTGLGLFLVREIVRAHRGEVSARSEGINRGAKFTIKLPLVGK